ncbi:MAG: nucleoside hydrolase [Albidovulum sp.]|nr:nucleoside hydrolase [Albidovulum sp.]
MRLWIDSDMGFDDLWAILTIGSLGIRIDGLSLVAGNAALPQVVRNACTAARAFDWDFPIFEGAESALLGGKVTAERILGATGIRSRGKALDDKSTGCAQPGAFEAIREWIESRSGSILLALGPLTNIAAVVGASPELAKRIERVVWMGGSVRQGNHTPSAEFNAFVDPEAAAALLSAQVDMTIVDLEICRNVRFGESDVRHVSGMGGRNAALLADLARGYLDIGLERGRDSMAIYDPVAAVALARPGLFGFVESSVEIVLSGSKRGQTIVNAVLPGEKANAKIAVDADHEAIRRVCVDTLLREGKR